MPTSVSAVIINYDGEAVLPACLESLLGQTRPPDEIIVVDNASKDDSIEACRQRYSGDEVQWVLSPTNVGFPAACNLGVQRSSGELIAILNNDIELDPGWLENLLLEVRPEWSFWASQIVFSEKPDRIDSAGDGIAVTGAGFKHGHGESATLYDEPREVFGACAAAALYRRELLEVLGGFDEDFFLIYEDVDLSFRARLMGFRCLYVPGAQVRHRVNASIGTYSRNYVYYGQRNSEYVFWKNMPVRLMLRYLPQRAVFSVAAFFYFLAKGRGLIFLKAKLDAALDLPEVLRKRRRLQSERRVSDAELLSLLDRRWLTNRGRAHLS